MAPRGQGETHVDLRRRARSFILSRVSGNPNARKGRETRILIWFNTEQKYRHWAGKGDKTTAQSTCGTLLSKVPSSAIVRSRVILSRFFAIAQTPTTVFTRPTKSNHKYVDPNESSWAALTSQLAYDVGKVNRNQLSVLSRPCSSS